MPVPAKHEEVGRDAVVVAKGRMGQPVAPEVLNWILRRGSWSCVRQKRANSAGVKNSSVCQATCRLSGVHEKGGDRVFLQAIPQPAQRVAREFQGGRGRLASILEVPGDRDLGACGMSLTDLHVRGACDRGGRSERSSADGFFKRLAMDEIARLRLREQVKPQHHGSRLLIVDMLDETLRRLSRRR